MPATVCGAPVALFQLENNPTDKDAEHADQSSVWTMIQSQKSPTPNTTAAPYVHPLVRRSSSLMSRSSLEMCTESVGSETGSGDFSDDDRGWLKSFSDEEEAIVKQKTRQQQLGYGIQMISVSNHCSIRRRTSTPRSYPPPLSSISCQDGTCIQMRTRRHDGRLVVEAVQVASQNYLNSLRQDGRLLISFVDSAATNNHTAGKATQEPPLKEEDQSIGHTVPLSKEINQSNEDVGDEDVDGEDVEVLNRGNLGDEKVRRQPDGAKNVLRSSLVINKFVGGTPLTNQNLWAEPAERNDHSDPLAASQRSMSSQHRLTSTISTTTAAAKREEMLHNMRRYSEVPEPLFFWEAGCIAAST